jgi:hypothetical protein
VDVQPVERDQRSAGPSDPRTPSADGRPLPVDRVGGPTDHPEQIAPRHLGGRSDTQDRSIESKHQRTALPTKTIPGDVTSSRIYSILTKTVGESSEGSGPLLVLLASRVRTIQASGWTPQCSPEATTSLPQFYPPCMPGPRPQASARRSSSRFLCGRPGAILGAARTSDAGCCIP